MDLYPFSKKSARGRNFGLRGRGWGIGTFIDVQCGISRRRPNVDIKAPVRVRRAKERIGALPRGASGLGAMVIS